MRGGEAEAEHWAGTGRRPREIMPWNERNEDGPTVQVREKSESLNYACKEESDDFSLLKKKTTHANRGIFFVI